jgi:hypothetical protein
MFVCVYMVGSWGGVHCGRKERGVSDAGVGVRQEGQIRAQVKRGDNMEEKKKKESQAVGATFYKVKRWHLLCWSPLRGWLSSLPAFFVFVCVECTEYVDLG